MKNLNRPQETIECPQCGYPSPIYFKHTKLIKCASCGSSLFYEDESVRLAGKSSVLSSEPSLLTLRQPFLYKGNSYLPIGMIRYSYGRGTWEEWWIKGNNDKSLWLSIDEGDLVLERKIDTRMDIDIDSLSIGDTVDGVWTVSEIDEGICEGFEGSLPKAVTVGDTHRYIHLSGSKSMLRTIEIDTSGIEIYEGYWISPFDIGKIY